MLSSRYLYLHEALGLGPMWLQQGARVMAATQLNAHAAADTASRRTAAQAILAGISSVADNSTAPAHQPISAPRTAPQPLPAAEQLLPAQADVAAPHQAQPAADEPSPYVVHQTLPVAEIVPALSPASAAELPAMLAACRRCALHNERRQPLAGQGASPAKLMVISPNPAPLDDSRHSLFSGDAGLLLNNMLRAIGIGPDDVFYTSQVKCTPNVSVYIQAEHIAACQTYLQQQIDWVAPRAVLLLGKAFSHMDAAALQQILHHIPYVIIPHPARLLRQQDLKAHAWAMLQQLRLYLRP